MGDRVGEGLELPVRPLELAVGVLEVLAGPLGAQAAAHEHRGDAEEEQADADTRGQHEEGEPALALPLEARQGGEVQAPLAPGHLDAAPLGGQPVVPGGPCPPHVVGVVEQVARPGVLPGVDLEVHGRVDAAPEDRVEQAVPPEGADDETGKGPAALGLGPGGLPLPVDRQVDHEAGPQRQVRGGAGGGPREHVGRLRGARQAAVPGTVHGGPVGGVRVEVAPEHVAVRLVGGRREPHREVDGALPARLGVRPDARQPFLLHPPEKVLALGGLHALGEGEGLEPPEAAHGLDALDVLLPLRPFDVVARQDEAAGAEHGVEVVVRAAVDRRLRGANRLLEAHLALPLDRVAHVGPGERGEQERDQQHPVGRRPEPQVPPETGHAPPHPAEGCPQRFHPPPPETPPNGSPRRGARASPRNASMMDNVPPTPAILPGLEATVEHATAGAPRTTTMLTAPHPPRKAPLVATPAENPYRVSTLSGRQRRRSSGASRPVRRASAPPSRSPRPR